MFVAVALIAIAIVLHAPWTGYETTWSMGMFGAAPIGGSLPFWSWQTVGAPVYWFGVLSNFLAVVLAIAVLLALWCFLYRQPKSSEGSNDTNP